jgi:hypothetical protein
VHAASNSRNSPPTSFFYNQPKKPKWLSTTNLPLPKPPSTTLFTRRQRNKPRGSRRKCPPSRNWLTISNHLMAQKTRRGAQAVPRNKNKSSGLQSITQTGRPKSRRCRQRFTARQQKEIDLQIQKSISIEKQALEHQEKQVVDAIQKRIRLNFGFVGDPALSR